MKCLEVKLLTSYYYLTTFSSNSLSPTGWDTKQVFVGLKLDCTADQDEVENRLDNDDDSNDG